MDEELRARVEQRARTLWEAAGSPEGHELTYRFRAEREHDADAMPIGKFTVGPAGDKHADRRTD